MRKPLPRGLLCGLERAYGPPAAGHQASVPAPAPASGAGQRGFALVELTLTLLVVAALSVYATSKVVQATDEAIAEATGVYVNVAAAGLQRYLLLNHDALASGTTTVSGVGVALQPTLAELKALGRISTNLPSFTPTQQQVRFDITRSNCPGTACTMAASVCTTMAYTVRGKFRDDLATVAMMAMSGAGGRSHIGAGSTVRGPSFSMDNPAGNIEGVVCAQNVVDAALYDRFVQRYDTRDPNLQGSLTTAGTVTSATGVGTSDGSAACLRAAMTSDGQFLARAADCTARVQVQGSSGAITSYSSSGVAKAGISYNASGQAQTYADTVNATTVNASSLSLSTSASANDACSTAGQIVQGSNAGVPILLLCSSGQWKAMTGLPIAAVGDSCSSHGALGVNTGGVSLICSSGYWITTVSRIGRWAVTSYYEVTDGFVIYKPACGSGGVSRLYEFPKSINGQNYWTNFKVVDYGLYWSIQITDGSGNALSGDAVAQVGCLYS